MTYSRGRRNGPGLVLTAAAGYVMPSLLGAGAAWLLAARHLTAMLWLALVLLAATFLAVRNLFGAMAVLVTAGGVFAVNDTPRPSCRPASPPGRRFLLFGGVRPVIELAGALRGLRVDASAGLGVRCRPARPADRRPGGRVGHAVHAGSLLP